LLFVCYWFRVDLQVRPPTGNLKKHCLAYSSHNRRNIGSFSFESLALGDLEPVLFSCAAIGVRSIPVIGAVGVG